MTTPTKELRALNRQLAGKGRRICEDCGANYPLSAEHFYPQKRGRHFAYVCKPCYRFRVNEKFKQRYAREPDFRRRVIDRSVASHAAHRDQHNARQLKYHHRIRASSAPLAPLKSGEHKRAGFERILSGLSREKRTP